MARRGTSRWFSSAVIQAKTSARSKMPRFLVEPLHLRDGKLAAPAAPGLGVMLPPDLEERYPYRPGSVYRILGN